MPIKSFKPRKKGYKFAESEMPPIHLGFIKGRDYYSFPDGMDVPTGGKDVSNQQMKKVLSGSPLLRDIKAEAQKRIEDVAPIRKQQSALIDMFMYGNKADLTNKQQKKLEKAQAIFEKVVEIRDRSDEIEDSFLNGVTIDFTTDQAWGMEAEPAVGEEEGSVDSTEATVADDPVVDEAE